MFTFEIQRFTESVRFEDFQSAVTRTKAKIDDVAAIAAKGIKSLVVEGNTVKFYTVEASDVTTETSVAATFDFPEELFLDQAGTTLVEEFAWSAATYPSSTDPNLEGKTVLVLAVKGDKKTNPTTKYSFVNLEKLIDKYTAADGETVIDINGYKVSIKVPEKITGKTDVNNALKKTANGLEVDVSDKADKVENATEGHIAALDASGNIVDSGYTFSTSEQTKAMLDNIFGAES